LEAAKAEVEGQVNRLSDTLAQETKRREQAYQEATENARQWREVEAGLSQSRQTNADLQNELLESHKRFDLQRENLRDQEARLEARSRELEGLMEKLAATQSRLDDETLQRQHLAEKLLELENSRNKLVKQAEATNALLKSKEDALQVLDLQFQERQAEVGRLHSLFELEVDSRRREQSLTESLKAQTAVLTAQLEREKEDHQKWVQRESELEHCIRNQKDQLANSASAFKKQQGEFSRLKSTVDDLQVIQTALCAQARELVAQRDTAVMQMNAMQDQLQAETNGSCT
jgi:hypothetical protein